MTAYLIVSTAVWLMAAAAHLYRICTSTWPRTQVEELWVAVTALVLNLGFLMFGIYLLLQ
jgi:hypothetical protein